MPLQAPPIDRRTAADIAQQVKELLGVYAPEWKEFDPVTGKRDDTGAALIGIFARYCDIIIQRLNRVPEKNFLAFLDMLGASLQPPQPARVPLTFSLAAGSTTPAVVPAGTQAAAPPAEGEKDPVIFETERELVVTPAQLTSVYTRDPGQDLYADHSTIIASSATPGVQVFRGNRRNEHMFYVGHDKLFGFTSISSLSLIFNLNSAPDDDLYILEWEHWDGTAWATMTPTGTLPGNNTIGFGGIASVPAAAVNAVQNRWLRCRLTTPVTRSTDPLQGMVRETQIPSVQQVEINVQLLRPASDGLLPEMIFANSLLIEAGTDFYPLGEKPKLNDSLHIASNEAFSKDRVFSMDGSQSLADESATVTLDIQVANSHLLAGAASVRPSEDMELAWESWNGNAWECVGTSTAPDWLSLVEIDPVSALTTEPSIVIQGTAPRGSSVVLQCSDGLDPATITATATPTVGEDGRFAAKMEPLSDGLNKITITASYKSREEKAWAVVFKGTDQPVQLTIDDPPQTPVNSDTINLTVNATGQTQTGQSVQTIRVKKGDSSWTGLPGIPISSIAVAEGRNEFLIEGLNDTTTIAAITVMISREAAQPTAAFADGTYGLCQSGTVILTLPNTVKKTVVYGQENYWLRVRLVSGDYGKEASYKLVDPTDPAKGFMLVLSSFRPPVISGLTIGYEQTLQGVPEQCLACNSLEYEDMTPANAASGQPFPLFKPSSDEKAAIYYGFTLPPNMTFPNRAVSLFNRTADLKYGEVSVPLSPEVSSLEGAAGSDVAHTFTITGIGGNGQIYNLECIGTIWAASVNPPTVTLDPGETTDVMVAVSIPLDVAGKDSDAGWLRITPADDTTAVYTAAFKTLSVTDPSSPEPPRLAWAYWNGTAWADLSVLDESESFSRTGLVEFLPPADFAKHPEFGLERFWIRAMRKSGDYSSPPRLQRLLLNTTMAAQTVTVKNEILGSSDQSEGQKFQTTRKPVLAGQQLEVRETEMPSAEEQTTIKNEESGSAITVVPDAAGRPQEIWVRWHEVPDFYGSGPRDRHYLIDHQTGEITFGDGMNGMIPPRGNGNLRMKQYQTGGGAAGNSAAGSIIQLKTTVPYVEKVINTEAAAGGAEAETTESLYERAPQSIRHRDRSVTTEDYEDLAMLASPGVARARCAPLRNLSADPLGKALKPGQISVIIVPRTTDAKPLPDLELVNRVKDYLAEHGIPTAEVHVVGPLYVRVDVSVEIGLVSPEGASAVEQTVRQKLAEFLHPLTGGQDGRGWNFGRQPNRSDLFALIEGVPGVDYIKSLSLDDTGEDPDGKLKKTGRFLVYSGKHEISMVFE